MNDDQSRIVERFFRPVKSARVRPGPGSAQASCRMRGEGLIADLINHVFDGADEMKFRLEDRREFMATVVGKDPQTDSRFAKDRCAATHSVYKRHRRCAWSAIIVIAVG